MSLRARVLSSLSVGAVALLGTGCAFSNPDKRPLFEAFDESVVPEDDAAFYATLPLTVPVGLAAVLLDAFVVWPVMTIDDAAYDAADNWDDIDWERDYVTEVTFAPVRAAYSGVEFGTKFLVRSIFDVSDHKDLREESPDDLLATEEASRSFEEAEQIRLERVFTGIERWLESPTLTAPPIQQFRDAGRQPDFDRARTAAIVARLEDLLNDDDPVRRLAAASVVLTQAGRPFRRETDPWADPDPAIRAVLITKFGSRLPRERLEEFTNDDSPLVRYLARDRLDR